MESSLAKHGVTEIERLARLGVLGPNVLLIHVGWATEAELELLQRHDVEVGRRADLVLFDTTRPEWQPLYNPLANLVYSATGRSVDTVICDGRVLVEGGRALTLDEGAIIEEARHRAPGVLAKTKLEGLVAPKWPVS